MRNDVKICPYCSSKFYKLYFPHCFDRMVTCGNAECEGKRRKELWRKRYNNMMESTGLEQAKI